MYRLTCQDNSVSYRHLLLSIGMTRVYYSTCHAKRWKINYRIKHSRSWVVIFNHIHHMTFLFHKSYYLWYASAFSSMNVFGTKRHPLSQRLMAEGVATNNQRGRRSGPCRLWGGLDIARHIVTTALCVRSQCLRKGMYKVVERPSTRPIVLSMINGSYCRRRRRLTIFEPDEVKFGVSWILLSL